MDEPGKARPRLWDRPILCLVVDRRASVLPVEDAVREAVRGGVDWLQIRERELEGGELLAWSESLARAAAEGAGEAGRRVAVLINRRIDVALALAPLGATQGGHLGVHLGFDALSPAVARALLGPDAWIGVSTHQPEEVEASARLPDVSYAHLAPIFAPLSKVSSRPALGLAALERACRSGLAVLAQGGMEAGNASQALAAGASGISVTGAILQSNDPRVAAQRLRDALDGAQVADTR